jgi:hypothetical protein
LKPGSSESAVTNNAPRSSVFNLGTFADSRAERAGIGDELGHTPSRL